MSKPEFSNTMMLAAERIADLGGQCEAEYGHLAGWGKMRDVREQTLAALVALFEYLGGF